MSMPRWHDASMQNRVPHGPTSPRAFRQEIVEQIADSLLIIRATERALLEETDDNHAEMLQKVRDDAQNALQELRLFLHCVVERN